jgi:hypothetical protein
MAYLASNKTLVYSEHQHEIAVKWNENYLANIMDKLHLEARLINCALDREAKAERKRLKEVQFVDPKWSDWEIEIEPVVPSTLGCLSIGEHYKIDHEVLKSATAFRWSKFKWPKTVRSRIAFGFELMRVDK